ncbi:MAG: hypothetical protein H0U76_18775 [Ktedonobacteraceae bacterium]|nr:hypothetical protein [Ktedonobacteraceae bacterium]
MTHTFSTCEIAKKLEQLKSQLEQLPTIGDEHDYTFSLDYTQRFADEVMMDLMRLLEKASGYSDNAQRASKPLVASKKKLLFV